jgi:TatD DNase family protein
MRLIDTHCHIHSADYKLDPEETLARAREAGVDRLICVGTSLADSERAAQFAAAHDGVFAAIGVHPHETTERRGDKSPTIRTKDTLNALDFSDADSKNPGGESCLRGERSGANKSLRVSSERGILSLLRDDSAHKIVGIGEIGLDYHFKPYDREAQIALFEAQLQIASDHNLPVSFHVREAFDDFWGIIDNFPKIRGVLHSFTDKKPNVEQGLKRGFYFGVNGIATYPKPAWQTEALAAMPLERIVLETDSPYLTPSSLRGKINEPAYVELVFEWVRAHFPDKTPQEVADITTKNAEELFNLHDRSRTP